MIKKLSKIFVYLLGLFVLGGVGIASYDLEITNISLANNGGNTISKGGKPDILVIIKNVGTESINLTNVQPGFIKCQYQGYDIGSTNVLEKLIINTGTEIGIGIKLEPLLTATARNINNINCRVNANNTIQEQDTNNNIHSFSLSVTAGSNYNAILNETTSSIGKHLDAAEPTSNQGGGVTVKNFIFNMLSNVLVPIIVLAGVIMGIIGGYQVLTSDKPEKLKEGILKIVFGIVGIIIILSAKYIGTVLFDLFNGGNMADLDSVDLAIKLYEQIAYPFIKIMIYLSLGILFLVLAGKTVSIVTSGDIKKAGTIILWTVISIFVIIGAKQFVEAIYGKQDTVLNAHATNLGEIGTGLLADKNIPLVYNVLNWIIWITSLLILILIIVHTFKILTNPDKVDNWKSLGKSLLYIFIGIMIIGAGYLITNVLIIN